MNNLSRIVRLNNLQRERQVRKRYSKEEDRIIRRGYEAGMTTDEIAALIPGRPKQSIIARARYLRKGGAKIPKLHGNRYGTTFSKDEAVKSQPKKRKAKKAPSPPKMPEQPRIGLIRRFLQWLW